MSLTKRLTYPMAKTFKYYFVFKNLLETKLLATYISGTKIKLVYSCIFVCQLSL